VRECGVYCEIIPYNYSLDKIKAKIPKAIILSGGPNSVYAENTPSVDTGVFELGIPVLGICYGDQFMTKALGGVVAHAGSGEYGKTAVVLDTGDPSVLRSGKEQRMLDEPSGLCGKSPGRLHRHRPYDECPIAAMQNEEKKLYGVQFHPEVDAYALRQADVQQLPVQYLRPVPATGPCLPSPRTRSRKSGKKSARATCCAP
jgi:GMP synthase (glutamine-hydrolysing)